METSEVQDSKTESKVERFFRRAFKASLSKEISHLETSEKNISLEQGDSEKVQTDRYAVDDSNTERKNEDSTDFKAPVRRKSTGPIKKTQRILSINDEKKSVGRPSWVDVPCLTPQKKLVVKDSGEKILIKNGLVVNEDGSSYSDVYLEDGIIKLVGNHLITPGGIKVIDATGLLILPGGIDSNVSFETIEKGIESADDITTGSKAALAGGTTTINELLLLSKFKARKELMDSKICCNYTFNVGLSSWSSETRNILQSLIKEYGINAVVIKTGRDHDEYMNDNQLISALTTCKDMGILPVIAPIADPFFSSLADKLFHDGITGPEGVLYSRPETIEACNVRRMIAIADALDAPIYVSKITSELVVKEIIDASQNGIRVFGEIVNAVFAADGSSYLQRNWRYAAGFVMHPPLYKNTNPDLFLYLLSRNSLFSCASAHKLYTAAHKAVGKDDFRKIPDGINGLEERLMVLWEKGVRNGKLSPCQFVALTSYLPAKIFGLYPNKGRIAVGADADIVIWDPQIIRTCRVSTMSKNSDFNVFEGIQCHGCVHTTICNGRIVYEDEKILSVPGCGKYCRRATFAEYIYNEAFNKYDVRNSARTLKKVDRDPYSGAVYQEPSEQELLARSSGTQFHGRRALITENKEYFSLFDAKFLGDHVRDHEPKAHIKVRNPPGGKSIQDT